LYVVLGLSIFPAIIAWQQKALQKKHLSKDEG
jgi:hypothetical protein